MEKQNYLYIYDLPKEDYSSVKLASYLKDKTNIELDRKPQVRRDLNKPFYTAIISIPDNQKFAQACQTLRYFELDNKPCRALPYDNELLGSNSQKLNEHNIFVRKIPSDVSASQLEEQFKKYGEIKSLKVSLNPDHSSRGYGFVCFQNPESASKALEETKDADVSQGIFYKPKDRRDMRKAFNNIYAKNFPEEWSDDEVKALFEGQGRIESIKVSKNDKGAFAFVCYNAEDKNDREYGPKCAADAVENLNGKEMPNGKKLYVKEALKTKDRQIEVTREALKYKNSKKRCNLYVKNFPENTTEETLRTLFAAHGEIESLRMFPQDEEKKLYAFVCFKKPDEASTAKQALNMSNTLGERPLFINHYEIKEYRQLVMEEAKDKQNFQQFRAQTSGPVQWSELVNSDLLLLRLQQIIQHFPSLLGQGQRRPQGQQRPQGQNYQNRQGNQRPHGQNQPHHRQQQTTQGGLPQGQNRPMNAPHPGAMNQGMPMPGPGMPMPAPTQGMPMPSAQPVAAAGRPQPAAASGAYAEYYQKTLNILPSVVEQNPAYKTQVGTAIYDFVV